MNQNQALPLITKYMAGEASEEDTKMIERWINESIENGKYFATLCDAWHSTDYATFTASDYRKKYGDFNSILKRKLSSK